ncbi:MAG TPA: hypothetical protein ENG33_00840, partial [Chloroflexi bacterium]|nr:hypothetical protein [Chloroflexota bacterium]
MKTLFLGLVKMTMRNVCDFLIALICIALVLGGCNPRDQAFSGQMAMSHLQKLCSFGPHPVGSSSQQRVRAYITHTLQKLGWEGQEQKFTYKGIEGCNIFAFKGEGKAILIGTHYDTRPYADRN